MRYLTLLLLLCVVFVPLPGAVQAQTGSWRDTPFVLYANGPQDRYASLNYTCWDPINPGQLLVAENGIGIARYDLRSGTRTLVVPAGRFNDGACSDSGWLYWGDGGGMLAFPPGGSEPVRLDPPPSAFARDGSDRLYAVVDGRLFVGNGGTISASYPTPFTGPEVTLLPSDPDARTLYALVLRRNPDPAQPSRYEIWFSPSGGVTDPATGGSVWELRSSTEVSGSYGGPYVRFMPLGEAQAPAGTLMIHVNPGYPGSSNRTHILLSNDGGRTFQMIEERGLGSLSYNTYYAMRDGILRFSVSTAPYGPRGFSFSVSNDGGRNWQELGKPTLTDTPEPDEAQIVVSQAAPQVIAMSEESGTYLSTDGARTWSRVGDQRGELQFSPYLPLQLLGRNGATLSVLDIGALGSEMTQPRPALREAGYAPETGQTISVHFLEYWQRNGGLARFGYPRTAAFREVNTADGRAYLTQYFERARFEYHPENNDPQYRVLLGLLGNERTATRRSEGPFLPKPAPGDPGEHYFAETGHAIRNSFKAYWERNGGLAVYGYPISDEFVEINPEDGQSYVVQYFERNRFEYHPENAGTSYEVLLGLLGNDVLRERGWLDS